MSHAAVTDAVPRQAGREDKVLQDECVSVTTTQVVYGRAELAPYAEHLADLLKETGAPVSARWTALAVWLRHHPEIEPWAVLVWSSGTLAAAALFSVRQRFGCWKITKLGESGEPTWLPARDPLSAAELAATLRRELRRLDVPWHLWLTDLPEHDPIVANLHAALPCATVEPGIVAPRLCFAAGTQLARYLSKNTRSAAAKARNRIARDGRAVTMSWTSDPDDIQACLPEIIDVHRRRNLQRRGRTAFAGPAETAEFTDLVRAQAEDGDLRLLTVRLDGELASFALCQVGDGVLWVYANLVSPDWLRYSAGTIANCEVVRMAHADPSIRCLDWGSGPQRYKLSGPVTMRCSEWLHAWSSRPVRLAWSLHHRRHTAPVSA
ncbi:MAG TPA: GNAT family N-acetyltransferase [Mycobacteriales bacterium]|nr:GNAT family N-acetyltransferase [Mycobacteriales bacterium]